MRRKVSWFLILIIASIGLAPTTSRAQSVNPRDQTITFWHPHSGERETVLNELIAQFNAENEWEITVEPRSLQNSGLLYDQIILQLTTLTENRTLPNVFVAAPYETALFALGGPVLDLTAFSQDGEWGFADRTDFVPGVSTLGYDLFTNTQLGWPERLFTEVVYVNMTALREIGYESPPTTWAEIRDIACQFFAQTGAPAFQVETRAALWSGMASAQGNPIFEPAPRYAFLGMTQPLEKMIELLVAGCISRQITPFAAQDAFVAGHAPFYFGSTSALPIVRDAIDKNPFDWQIIPMPEAKMPYLSGPTLSIFSHSPESDLAAWLFLRWWLSPEVSAAWNRGTGSLPIRLSSAELMAPDFEGFSQWRAAWAIVSRGGGFEPSVAAQDVVRLEIEFAVERILDDPSRLQTELEALEVLANEILIEFAPRTKQASP